MKKSPILFATCLALALLAAPAFAGNGAATPEAADAPPAVSSEALQLAPEVLESSLVLAPEATPASLSLPDDLFSLEVCLVEPNPPGPEPCGPANPCPPGCYCRRPGLCVVG